MIFEQDSIVFQILEVLFLDYGTSKKYNFKRNFEALSFRYEGDTTIEFKGKKVEFCDNSIGYFPANVDYTRITTHDKMIVVHFKSFNYHTGEIEKFVPLNPEKYQLLFEKIYKCWINKNEGYKHDSASYLNLIFSELYKDNKKTNEAKTKIDLSKEYLENNCMKKDFSVQKAAEKSFMSETYFRKLFRQEFGVSPKQYVINKRIKYAASLIISGYHSLQEISELCGYNDYKHFSSEFKKLMGVSPSKYVYEFDE